MTRLPRLALAFALALSLLGSSNARSASPRDLEAVVHTAVAGLRSQERVKRKHALDMLELLLEARGDSYDAVNHALRDSSAAERLALLAAVGRLSERRRADRIRSIVVSRLDSADRDERTYLVVPASPSDQRLFELPGAWRGGPLAFRFERKSGHAYDLSMYECRRAIASSKWDPPGDGPKIKVGDLEVDPAAFVVQAPVALTHVRPQREESADRRRLVVDEGRAAELVPAMRGSGWVTARVDLSGEPGCIPHFRLVETPVYAELDGLMTLEANKTYRQRLTPGERRSALLDANAGGIFELSLEDRVGVDGVDVTVAHATSIRRGNRFLIVPALADHKRIRVTVAATELTDLALTLRSAGEVAMPLTRVPTEAEAVDAKIDQGYVIEGGAETSTALKVHLDANQELEVSSSVEVTPDGAAAAKLVQLRGRARPAIDWLGTTTWVATGATDVVLRVGRAPRESGPGGARKPAGALVLLTKPSATTNPPPTPKPLPDLPAAITEAGRYLWSPTADRVLEISVERGKRAIVTVHWSSGGKGVRSGQPYDQLELIHSSEYDAVFSFEPTTAGASKMSLGLAKGDYWIGVEFEALHSGLAVDDCVTLGRHSYTFGQDNWTDEMNALVGRRARIVRLLGQDLSGAFVAHVDIDDGAHAWRTADMEKCSDAN